MGIEAAIIGGAALSAAGGIYSSRQAAKAQEQAAAQATNTELQMYYQSREDQAPWREAGATAVEKLPGLIEAGPGPYEESPYYNFLIDEGTKAIARTASATGELGSGAIIKDAERYGQGLASTEYNNWINQWINTKLNPMLSLANLGQISAGQTSNAALQTGQNIGQAQILAGQGLASGYLNQANVITGASNAATQAYNNYLFYNFLRNQQNPNVVGGSTLPSGTSYYYG